MSRRATALAAEFERANRAIIEAVAQCSADRWGTLVPGENRTAGVVARPIAALA